MKFSKGKCKVLLAPNASPRHQYMLWGATRWKTALQKGDQDEHEPEMCPWDKEGLWCPGQYQGECCQQVVGGDASTLFSTGEATLVLCEHWGWTRWPPNLPNNLNHHVTLWFYENSIFSLLSTKEIGYGKLAGGANVILTKRARCTITVEIEN